MSERNANILIFMFISLFFLYEPLTMSFHVLKKDYPWSSFMKKSPTPDIINALSLCLSGLTVIMVL